MTNPLQVKQEVYQEAPRTLLVEDREFVGKFTPADATPSVLNLKRWKAGNTGANNLTFFDDGFEGKEISILGDGFTTVVFDVAKIKTNSAANKLLSVGRVYRFTMYNGIWVEDEDLTVGGAAGDMTKAVYDTDNNGVVDLATTVPNDAITDAKLRNSAGTSVIGKTAAGAGDPADIVAGADGDVLRRAGGALAFGAIPEASVTNLVADLAAKEALANKGVASGYASLDAGTKLPLAQLPAHKTTHEPGGTDAMTVDAIAATGSLRTLGAGAQQAVSGTDARLSDARTPTAHHLTHEPGGTDPMAVDAAAATGSLRTLGVGAAQAAAGNDARLSDARTPTVHGAVKHDATVEATANKGVASGYAPLDTDTKVPLVNLHVPVGDKDVGNISLSATQYLLQYERITLTGTERLGLTGSTRAIVTDLHSKDDVIVGTPRTPSLSFKIPDGYVASIPARLTLDKSIRATIQGLGQLIVFDDFGTRSRIVLAGRSS